MKFLLDEQRQRVLFRPAHLCVNRGRTNRGMTEWTLNAELMLAR
jgi:hypothetical protein